MGWTGDGWAASAARGTAGADGETQATQQPMTIWALAGAGALDGASRPITISPWLADVSWQDIEAGAAQAPLTPSVSMAMTPIRPMMRDRPRTRPN